MQLPTSLTFKADVSNPVRTKNVNGSLYCLHTLPKWLVECPVGCVYDCMALLNDHQTKSVLYKDADKVDIPNPVT